MASPPSSWLDMFDKTMSHHDKHVNDAVALFAEGKRSGGDANSFAINCMAIGFAAFELCQRLTARIDALEEQATRP